MNSSHSREKFPDAPPHLADAGPRNHAPAEYQEIADKSPVVAQLKANQARADAYTARTHGAPAQRMATPVAQLRKKKKAKPVAEDPDADPFPEVARTDGSQDLVQPKMVQALQLIAGNVQGGPRLAEWYGLVNRNGLCGGWAAVHRAAPDELVRVWKLVEDWNPTTGLQGLGRDNAFTIAALLSHAYDVMNVLEPDEDYGNTPDVISSLAEIEDPNDVAKVDSFRVTVPKAGGGGAMILQEVLDNAKVKNPGNTCFIHIETEKHHMSMRTRSANNKVKVLDIVETEKIGVVSAPSTKEAQDTLDAGIYLTLSDFRVDVNIYVLK